MQAWDVCNRPYGLVRIFHFPSAEAPGYWQSPLRVFAEIFC
jgi:hypothetical protein